MADEQPITAWIGGAKEGAADAEQGLWEAYFHRLLALARTKMRETPATWEDEEDIALSAMKSFFCRLRSGHFPKLRDRTELWPLLVQTTVWKIQNFRRRHFAKIRDVRNTVPLEWLAENKPTTELAERLIEERNSMLDTLTDEKLRSVAVMKLDGYTNAEIAEKIGRTEKTVEWRLRQVRKHLLEMVEKEESR